MSTKSTEIAPNESILRALVKVSTGANIHDINEFTGYYKHACRLGSSEAGKWEDAFNAYLSGRITPLRRAVALIYYEGKPPIYPNQQWWEQGE